MPTAPSGVHLLAQTALKQERLSGLCEVLRVIAETYRADGCILWEVVPGSNLETREGALFTLAQWISKSANQPHWAMYDLGLHSVAGEAALAGKRVLVTDIENAPLIHKDRPFYQKLHPDSMCSIPVAYLDGAKGSMTLFRKRPPAFTENEVQAAQQDIELVPDLYQAIRNRVTYRLLLSVNDMLHKAEIALPTDPAITFQQVCQEVSHAFQCFETSVYLEDPLDPGRYKIRGTTWPYQVDKEAYEKDDTQRTGWVLNHKQAVNVFDLVNLPRDRVSIPGQFPGFPCNVPEDFVQKARESLGLGPDDVLQPLSFMAAPIMAGDDLQGVIRCYAAKEAPYYFAARELALLKLVANRLSQFWSTWVRHREIQDENQSWHALVHSVGEMNTFVHHELSQKSPAEIRIWQKGLEVTKGTIPGAEIISVRLRDRDNHLYFEATEGEAWKRDSGVEIRKRRFTLDNPEKPSSLGSHVFHTRKPYLTDDVPNDPYYYQLAAFPGVQRIIVAPIRSEEDVFGVLDIQCTANAQLPRHAKAIAQLIGEQLGLYHFLSLTIAELHKVPQVYEDLGHQLKTPVLQAYERVKALFETRLPPLVEASLTSVRALLFKATRVVTSTRLFAELEHKGEIKIRQRPLSYTVLMALLDQAASDNQLMVPPFRNIKFRVETGPFSVFRERELTVDHDLLAQALNNILDNAAKYSNQGTVVRITGGTIGKDRDRLHITVSNTGLRLGPQEAKLCRQRGWRGDEAEWNTGEGSGIGLWIVDHIMRAHNGELEIVPTNRYGVTEVRLIFPIARR
jgi:signal transduction histidine kinase